MSGQNLSFPCEADRQSVRIGMFRGEVESPVALTETKLEVEPLAVLMSLRNLDLKTPLAVSSAVYNLQRSKRCKENKTAITSTGQHHNPPMALPFDKIESANSTTTDVAS